MQQRSLSLSTRCNAHQLPLQTRLQALSPTYLETDLRHRSVQGLPCHRLRSRHLRTLAARHIACRGAATASSDQGGANASDVPANQQGFRHAILHDFCMSIPFGSIVLAAGMVSLLFGSGRQGLTFALAGSGVLAASFFSLVQWRQQRPSTVFTLVSAVNVLDSESQHVFGVGITAALAWGFWDLVEAGIAAVPNTVMSFLSLAMLTFLIYNIFAGGNPPKKTTPEDDAELAAAAAAAT